MGIIGIIQNISVEISIIMRLRFKVNPLGKNEPPLGVSEPLSQKNEPPPRGFYQNIRPKTIKDRVNDRFTLSFIFVLE